MSEMTQGLMRQARREDGMTIIEVMLAAMILFFVLTAVLALVLATTRMGVTSRQRMVLTNATNTYIERVQSLDFEYVDLVGSGEGVLALEETMTIDGFTVRIVPEITPGENDALKNLHISIWVSPAGPVSGLNTMFRETTVVVRNRDEFLTRASRDPATDPTVEFIDPQTPPAYSVVWGQSYQLGALLVAARAEAKDGRSIDSVNYTCEGLLLKDSFGQSAQWYPDSQLWETYSFVWNTLQKNDANERMFFDGDRTVTVTVIDSDGAMITRSRHFLLDNDPPDTPGPPNGEAVKSDGIKLTWVAPMDGNLPADHYGLEVYRQPLTAISDKDPFDDSSGWGTPAYETETQEGTQLALGASPFSRYWYRIKAIGPYPNVRVSGWSEMAHPFVTRPVLTGTEQITITRIGINYYADVTNTLTVTPPTFPVGSITYDYYRGFSRDTMTLVASSPDPTFIHTYPKSLGKFGKTDPYYYQVNVTYTAAGYGGGVTEPVVLSNIIGPTTITQRDSIPTQPITGSQW